jgi:hypothetical protein
MGKQKRKTPGDPACENCRTSRRGYCKKHKTFHYEYDPTAGLTKNASSRRDPFDDNRGWHEA